ncbi:uncharacterized protein B0T23DRAFT_374369 [Neurospora hispaniola]|uniref:Uncharacterized protein n=1 Tax=Neurospora hispaniola TaxID=588809 RepID=A0AAJ0ICY7_9PEZI|nr:hypothetical protein B0T23DRAFT_374369 [Neurospora hispaniola]
MVMAMSVWLLGSFAVSPCVVVCCFWILARYAGHTVYAVLVDLQCFVSMGTYSEPGDLWLHFPMVQSSGMLGIEQAKCSSYVSVGGAKWKAART